MPNATPTADTAVADATVGSETLVLPRRLAVRLLHAAQCSPDAEICGLVAASDGQPDRFLPVPNVAAEPAREFRMDDAELVAAGERVFRKCKSCHQVGEGAKNRTGPALNGIVGHPAGAIDGFSYSKALKQAGEDGLIWTEEDLKAFLAKPRDYLQGTKMSFSGLRKEADQAAVVEYLKSFAEE